MTTPPRGEQPWQPHGLTHTAQHELIEDARRAGIEQFHVQALWHRRHLLLPHEHRACGSGTAPAVPVRLPTRSPPPLDQFRTTRA